MSIKSTTLSGGTPTTIYQSAGRTAVTTSYFCNRGTTLALVNIHLVPSTGIASADNLIYWQLEIDVNDTYVIDTERLIFDDGDSIVALSSEIDTIVATVSHVEV